jgi:hypothetical protein
MIYRSNEWKGELTMPPKDEGFCSQHDRLMDNDNRLMERVISIGELTAQVNTKVALLLEDHGNRLKAIEKFQTRLSYAVVIIALAAVGSPAYGPVIQRLLAGLMGS